VLNSASLLSTYIVPGAFITFTGFGIGPEIGVSAQPGASGTPTTLGGVQVLFDGNPAPVIYAQSREVNAQVPFEVAGQSKTTVSLVYNGASFGPLTMEISFADPALFRLQPNVSAQAYAVNEDGTINTASNPAAPGSLVALFGTGMGATDPPCPTGGLNADGPVNLESDLTVILKGQGGPIQYAGSAPTLPCGVVQVNMYVPADAAPGPLTLIPWEMQGQSTVEPEWTSIIYVK
jgi:uncharacterized protein (TIGR03437 family)